MYHVQQLIENFTFSNIAETYEPFDPNKNYIFEPDEALTSNSVALYKSYYWRSITNGHAGNYPVDAFGNVNSNWIKIDSSNIYSLLDLSNTTGAEHTDDIILEFDKNILMEVLSVGKFNASSILIEYLDEFDVVLASQTEEFSVNENVYDHWDYGYAPYERNVNRNIKFDMIRTGVKIRVTLSKAEENICSCRFIVAGSTTDFGEAINQLSTSYESYITTTTDALGVKNNTILQRAVKSFDTIVERGLKKTKEAQAIALKDKKELYVIFPKDEQMEFEIILGQLETYNDTIKNEEKNTLSFSIKESI